MIPLHISEDCSHLYKTGSVDLMKPRNISSWKEEMKTWFLSVDKIISWHNFNNVFQSQKRQGNFNWNGQRFKFQSNVLWFNEWWMILKIRSLDRFDDFMNFRSETDMIISRKKKLSMLRGTWGCHNLFWKRWKWQSSNFSIRQFKTSVTSN